MDHLTDGQIARLVAGEVPGDVLRRHADLCASCAARIREQERLWSLLGRHGVEPPVTNLASAVLDRLDRGGAKPVIWWNRPAMVWLRGSSVRRVAAAVLLGVGLGHAMGRWTTSERLVDAGARGGATVSAAEVVESLGLDAFCAAPTGLPGLFDDGPETLDEEGRS